MNNLNRVYLHAGSIHGGPRLRSDDGSAYDDNKKRKVNSQDTSTLFFNTPSQVKLQAQNLLTNNAFYKHNYLYPLFQIFETLRHKTQQKIKIKQHSQRHAINSLSKYPTYLSVYLLETFRTWGILHQTQVKLN